MEPKNLPPRPGASKTISAETPARPAAPRRPGASPGQAGAPEVLPAAGGRQAAAPVPTTRNPPSAVAAASEGDDDQAPVGFIQETREWLFASGNYYLASMLIHMALFLLLALVLGVRYVAKKLGEAPSFDPASQVAEKVEVPKAFDLTVKPDVETSELDLTVEQPPAQAPQEAKFFDKSEKFVDEGGGFATTDPMAIKESGGGEAFETLRPGPAVTGPGGLGAGSGSSQFAGVGGSGSGFGGRGAGHRDAMLGRYGGTKATERAVAAALNWLARHQRVDGSWSLSKFSERCSGARCDGAGQVDSDAAGTAFGVLPFLAAGQTHMNKGPYQSTVRRALNWLVTHQDRTGDLAVGPTGGPAQSRMYTHGLCTIALCEAYGMTHDSRIGYAAQAAIKFCESAQDPAGGGWRYAPQQPGDTSVVGWQVMGLKSGLMADLQVSPATFTGVRKYLAAASGSDYGATFAYQPNAPKTPTMTAVGLLCRQYMGAPKDDPGLTEGVKLLMANLPDDKTDRTIYYWYYATQVMHNMLGDDWDTWNRKMRRVLVDSQVGGHNCATGSWDPARPTPDAWGGHGGRVMITSLSCLCLEIYYRYEPLFDLGKKGAVKGADDGHAAAPAGNGG